RASVLVCLDAARGTLLWEKVRPAVRACYSSPFIVERGGKKELILVTTPGIIACDLTDGHDIWKFDWKFDNMPLRTVGSAIQAQDMIIAASGDGSGERNFMAVKIGDKGNVSTTNLVWENKKNKN